MAKRPRHGIIPCYIGRVLPLGKTHQKIYLRFLPAAAASGSALGWCLDGGGPAPAALAIARQYLPDLPAVLGIGWDSLPW